MKKLTEKMFYTRFPQNEIYNVSTKNEKDKKSFLNIYSLYVSWLNRYLYDNTSIKEYEKILSKSKLNITPISKENHDVYQYLAEGVGKYYYLRNNTYIERLIQEDIDMLKKRISLRKTAYDIDSEVLVKYTFKNIIREMKNIKFENEIINYGPNNSNKFYAGSNTLVIGARFNNYMEKIDTEEDKEKYIERVMFFRNACKELEIKLSSELEMDVKVIEYDEFSTINGSMLSSVGRQ